MKFYEANPYSEGMGISCNGCRRGIEPSGGLFHCSECNYDLCTDCDQKRKKEPDIPVYIKTDWNGHYTTDEIQKTKTNE